MFIENCKVSEIKEAQVGPARIFLSTLKTAESAIEFIYLLYCSRLGPYENICSILKF